MMGDSETLQSKAVDLWNSISPIKVTESRPMNEADDLYMNYAAMRIIDGVLVVDVTKIGDLLEEVEEVKRGDNPYFKTIFSFFGAIPPEFPNGSPSPPPAVVADAPSPLTDAELDEIADKWKGIFVSGEMDALSLADAQKVILKLVAEIRRLRAEIEERDWDS